MFWYKTKCWLICKLMYRFLFTLFVSFNVINCFGIVNTFHKLMNFAWVFFIKYHMTSLSISWLGVVLSKVVSLLIYFIYYVLEVDMFLLSGIMPSICCINWTNITFKLYFGVSFEMMTLCQRFLIYPTSLSPLVNLGFWPCRFLLKLNFENLLNLFAKNDKTFIIPKALIKCKELC